jgi:hypothetical protein
MTALHCSSRIRLDPVVAEAVRGPLADRLTAHAMDHVKALPTLWRNAGLAFSRRPPVAY